jgi:SPP1 family predicted phage head-tail adaptor
MKRAPGTDSGGSISKDWVPAGEIWADVRFQSGAETMRAGAEVSSVKASIRIRARAGVDASMRALYRGMTFDIQAILPDNDRAFAFLVCQAVK